MRAELTNRLSADTTMHWHGLAILNDMDGVPVLTQPPVPAGQVFDYEFVVPDAGTYWFHSHVGTQLDRGLYGPLIIEDPDERTDYDDELVVVLDDWIDGTGTNPDQVLDDLQKTGMPVDGDMDAEAGVTPVTPLGDDGGDVTYPYFLINGRVTTDPQVVDYRAGQRIRLRVINAGSDTAFRVAVPNTDLTVIHTDGYPVVPRQTDSVILGMGERVDAMITVASSLPVIAAAEGKNGLRPAEHARQRSAEHGEDRRLRRGSAKVESAGYRGPGRDTRSATAGARPEQTLELRLAGPVNGYTWTINGKLYDPPNDGLAVTPGQRVRIRYINESMMFHPMHLHGVTFQVLQRNGPAARKDTVLVPAEATVEIDFDTNNPGRWISHCHNTYHLEAGMASFVEYTG